MIELCPEELMNASYFFLYLGLGVRHCAVNVLDAFADFVGEYHVARAYVFYHMLQAGSANDSARDKRTRYAKGKRHHRRVEPVLARECHVLFNGNLHVGVVVAV